MNNDYCFNYVSANNISSETFEQICHVENNSSGEPYSREELKQIVYHNGNDNFLCLQNNVVIGFITANPNSIRLGGSIYIINMSVHKDNQRQGVGSKLIDNLINYYYQLNINKPLTLNVDKTNLKAFSLYKKLTFETIEDLSDKDSFMMTRPLALQNTKARE